MSDERGLVTIGVGRFLGVTVGVSVVLTVGMLSGDETFKRKPSGVLGLTAV